MIEIAVICTGVNRRGLLWSATAIHAGRRFVVERSLQPVRDALRAVIDGTPGSGDCPWRLTRDGRVDLSGKSARWMAAHTVEESDRGTRLVRDKGEIAAIYAPSGAPPVGPATRAPETAETEVAAA